MNVGLGKFVWRKYNMEEQRFAYLKNINIKYSLIIVQLEEVGVL